MVPTSPATESKTKEPRIEVTLSIEDSFDYGHRIFQHKSKCARMHGHTSHVTLNATGILDLETGMLVDFSKLKQTLKSVLEDLDHRSLYSSFDPMSFKDPDSKIIHPQPTAEAIAYLLIKILAYRMGLNSDFKNVNEISLCMTEGLKSSVYIAQAIKRS